MPPGDFCCVSNSSFYCHYPSIHLPNQSSNLGSPPISAVTGTVVGYTLGMSLSLSIIQTILKTRSGLLLVNTDHVKSHLYLVVGEVIAHSTLILTSLYCASSNSLCNTGQPQYTSSNPPWIWRDQIMWGTINKTTKWAHRDFSKMA